MSSDDRFPKEVDRIEGVDQRSTGRRGEMLTGGRREGTVYYTTVLSEVTPEIR